MKKILSVLLSLLLLCSCIPLGAVQAATAATVYGTVDQSDVAPGDTFTMSVQMENNPGLVCWLIDVDFDSAALELVSQTKGDAFSGIGTFSFGPIQEGYTNALWYDFLSMDNYTNNGRLFSLTFRVKEGAPVGSYPITLYCSDWDNMCNIDFERADFDFVSPTVTVVAAEEPACEHEYFYACDRYCMNCYELTNPDAQHSVIHVVAVAPTCDTMGNIAYWFCELCGTAWLNAECTQVTNRKAVQLPAMGHVYDDDYDADCNACGETRDVPDMPVAGSEATLDFHDKANRISYTTEQQVWAQNGITVINDKAGSASIVGDYGGEGYPARFYKGSALTVEYAGMTKIVFNCDDYKASYPTDLAASITDGTVSVDGTMVTVTFNAPVDSLFIPSLAAQVRMDSITVNATEGDEPGVCEHVYFDACSPFCELCGEEREVSHNVIAVEAKAATCTELGNIAFWYCDVCGQAWLNAECTLNTNLMAVKLPMIDHVYDDEFDADCNACGTVREVEPPDGAIHFSVEDAEVQRGDFFTVALRAENNPGLISFRLGVSYDTALLELTDYAAGDAFRASDMSHGSLSNVPFTVSWVDALQPNTTANGVVAWLTFRAKEGTVPTETNIDLICYDSADMFNDAWEDVPFTLSSGTVTLTNSEPEPPAIEEWTVATELKAGVTYKLGLDQIAKGAIYYFTGVMSTYYGATDTAVDNAVDMFVEIVDGGYKLYFFDSYNAKKYIKLEQSGNHYNFTFGDEGSVFALDAERNALYTTAGDQICYMGTYGNYVTIGILRADKLKDTDYIARLYTNAGGDEPVDPDCQHEYFYSCDQHCMLCGELTNPNASHSLTYVAAVKATCIANGNIAYWTCVNCGTCWDNAAATGLPLNRMMTILPATGVHTYSNALDASCNVCGAIRAVDSAVIYGVVSDTTVECGDTFTLDVSIQGNPGLCAWNVTVDYNEAALELVQVTPGNVFSASNVSYGKLQSPFSATFVDAVNPDVTGDGMLICLTFRVKDSAVPGAYAFVIGTRNNDLDNFFNENWETVPVQFENTSVSVVAHTHTYASTVIKAPTCGAMGIRSYTCSTCGDYYTESIPATGNHVYDAAFNCTQCGYSLSVIYGTVDADVVAPGDTFTLAVNMTNNPGLVGWLLDVDFDSTVLELVSQTKGEAFDGIGTFSFGPMMEGYTNALWYDFISVEDYTNNGCMFYLTFRVKEGASAGVSSIRLYCSDTDNLSNAQFETPYFEFKDADVTVLDHRHTYDNACDATCNICGVVREVEPHTYVSEMTLAPTCGANGVMTYTCSACGDAYTVTIPATGNHIYDNACDATCNVCGGIREVPGHSFVGNFTCAVCGYTLDPDSDAIIYSEVDMSIVAPGDTFTVMVNMANNPGLCGWLVDIDYDMDAFEMIQQTKGDIFTDGNLTFGPMNKLPTAVLWYDFLNPNVTDEGTLFSLTFRVKEGASVGDAVIRLYCADPDNMCNDQDETVAFEYVSVLMAVIDHHHTYDNACDATCNICGEVREVEPHAYESEITVAATCGANGVMTYTCSACGNTYTEVIPATGEHTYKAVVTAPDCTNGGYTTYTCAVCGHAYVVDYTAALGHNYVPAITVAATCGANGVMTYTCSACGDTYTEVIPATGEHTYDNACDATCNVCGGVREVPGHSFVGSFTCAICGYALDVNSDPIIHGTVDVTDAAPGETFTLTVNMANNPGLSGWLVGIDYDIESLELIEQTAGDIFNPVTFGPKDTLPTRASWYDFLSGDTTASGVLFSLTFRVKEGVSTGDTVIKLYSTDPDNFTTADDQTVYFDFVGAVVSLLDHRHVYESAITTAPTCVAEGVLTYTCSICGDSYTESIPATGVHTYDDDDDATCNDCDYVRELTDPGDVNKDGKVNIRDVGLMQQWMNGWNVEMDEKVADVNNDGKVNIRDVGLMQQWMNGWNVELI